MFHLQCRELNELNLAILFNANVELYAIDLRVFIRAIDSKRAREEVKKNRKEKNTTASYCVVAICFLHTEKVMPGTHRLRLFSHF